MADQKPWLKIIGVGEDGLNGLDNASLKAIADATSVFGAPRHLKLLKLESRAKSYPVPFSIDPVLEHKGQPCVVLASGDPFWYGAGTSITKHLKPHEWVAYPSASTFSRAASILGWPLEHTHCIGLHAQPFETIWPKLHENQRFICLMRDGDSAVDFCKWLSAKGFEKSEVTFLEALGGKQERVRTCVADELNFTDIMHPIALAFKAHGQGISCACGLDDQQFETDGQLTKRPIRAMALSALAPRDGELLWDLGAGSGTITMEWLLCAPQTRAIAIERREDRIDFIHKNANKFGVEQRLKIHHSQSKDNLSNLPIPDAVFIGGGASAALINEIWEILPKYARLVVHAVTIETEHLLMSLSEKMGGEILRVEMSSVAPLGTMKAWKRAYPLTEWRIVK